MTVFSKHKIVIGLALLCWKYSEMAYADIYLDASKPDEIRLSNNPTDVQCCVLIVEPAANLTDVALSGADESDAARKLNGHLPYQREVVAAAKATSLEPALIHAVIATESHHNTRAISPRGAQGLMQLMPFTAKRLGVKNAFDPKENIMAGARYLKELKDLFNGDTRLALAAYNAGPEAVNRYGKKIPPYRETMLYVPKVINTYQMLISY